MQQFRTILTAPKFDFRLDHRDHMLCIGSCFAENIALKLQRSKFSALLNPFGILYNPLSITKALELLLNGNKFSEDQLFQNQGLWHSFDHHGHFSKPEKATTLQGINQALKAGHDFLKHTNRIIVTLGTANVFVYKKDGEIVANCHKLPGNEFERKRLSVETVMEKLIAIFKKLKVQNPELQVITTVSPVRHIRDGIVENQKSKAVLLIALDKVCAELEFVHYFPSYEILLDDLRDYRFYEADLIHPSAIAIDYIWNIFQQSFFQKETKDLIAEIEKVIVASEHRSFNPETEQHQSFLKQQLEKIKTLKKKYAFLDFQKEVDVFNNQLS